MTTILILSLIGAILAAVVGTFWYSDKTPMGKIHMSYLGFDKLSKEEQEKVLLETGTYFTEPIIIKQNARLIARKILKNLPFSDIIKRIYYYLGLNKYVY